MSEDGDHQVADHQGKGYRVGIGEATGQCLEGLLADGGIAETDHWKILQRRHTNSPEAPHATC